MSKHAKTLKVKDLELELPDADEEARINEGIAADPDTFEVSDGQFKKMRGRPVGSHKTLVHIRLDNDVVEKFKATGSGWQTRINEALKKVNPV
ncbi:BrnA antitoxin family protein [Methylophilus sp. VKM B-3414]|uniref:BrnA antitoxin family protein n=1 Tax=Methylophilus sp. VKM B-3414 TaxID=3076121 RepID=UPI0028C61D44|nr:BrnA antitoxin family protein [Methylophilus sp. VKM B-3414]MDT7849120.1 BrnA antitoxin family protein [Methylophilus sp. VKM B-3414]